MQFPALILAVLAVALPAAAAPVPDFNREIRPILSDNCFRCHGPDEHDRKGGQNGLRLDTRAGATADLGGGGFAIVPGKVEKSELLDRLVTTDDEELMPPRKTGKTLSPREIELLRRWIAGGAPYAEHWSYVPPRRPELPAAPADRAWAGPIDRLLLPRIVAAGLRPQPEADRLTLARRVALDLTGLPPAPEEVAVFVADAAPDAYARFVDRQLAKPAFGEHWARLWLDLARYADSKGYADDQPRSIWRYRDYVIDAFNRNLPYDRFTVEQLAGDLLPEPTEDQIFATGFHRNTMNNTEGGTDDEEFRVAAVIDRVNTTMAVWMGTSIACAQCHTHKYDPLTHKEYFGLYALFNQSADADRSDEAPVREFFTAAQQRARGAAEAEIARLVAAMRATAPMRADAARAWAQAFPAELDWQPVQAARVMAGGKAVAAAADGTVLVPPAQAAKTVTVAWTPAEALTALRLESVPRADLPGGGAGGAADGSFLVSRVRIGIKPSQPAREARYVRIELPGRNRTLALAEVQVWHGTENLAPGGTATQSSVADGAVAARATDGRTDGNPDRGSVSTTAPGDNPWWELDLGKTAALDRVVLWGRTGLEPTAGGLKVSLLDAQRATVWEQTSREAPRPKKELKLGDPVDVKIARTSADFAQAEFDETYVGADMEPKSPNRKKPGATKRGWGVAGAAARGHRLTLEPEKPLRLQPGESLVVTVQSGGGDGGELRSFRLAGTSAPRAGEHLRLPADVLAALRTGPAERSPAQAARLLDHYVREVAPESARDRARVAAQQKELDDMPVQTSPIMRELPPERRRKTQIHLRGNFLALGEEVGPGVPAVFPPLPADKPADRLALARWLMAPENPLTARVHANRLWEAIFGLGLVRTTEEFGSQGEPPSHPELLDWLAVELRESGWDTKHFLKLLVMSAAYRQEARVAPAALEIDPENRLLARGPRVRHTAEMIRDQALAVSGLLSLKGGGPSVRPFQPVSGLNAAFGGALDWKPSTGEDRLRRGLYTEWRRSSPYPSMAAFDAPNREVCTLRRNRSNTPLQALVTLNDPVYIEAAQALGRRMAALPGGPEEQIRAGFRLVLLRPPATNETAPLVALYRNARDAYAAAPAQAALFAGQGEAQNPPAGAAEAAAWTAVANVLLNLDETLMKR